MHRFLFLKGENLMKKKLFLFALLPLMMSSLTGCSKKADFNIGILQWVEIEALTRATNGFKEAFKKEIGSKTVNFETKIAYGDSSAGSSIINTFVSKNKNLIMGNATPCVVLAATATSTIPVVGTSVTTYEGAFQGTIPSNVTGTSDLADLAAQAQMIFDWVPDATKVGILYCTSESNSKYQADMIKTEINKIKSGVTIDEIKFSDTNELSQQLTAKVNSLDVLYIPTDNTCADNANAIYNICSPAKLPIIAGEEGICRACGLASLTIDYYRLGQVTGKMAAKILVDGKDPSELPIEYDTDTTKVYNPAILAELGMSESDVPEGYVALS